MDLDSWHDRTSREPSRESRRERRATREPPRSPSPPSPPTPPPRRRPPRPRPRRDRLLASRTVATPSRVHANAPSQGRAVTTSRRTQPTCREDTRERARRKAVNPRPPIVGADVASLVDRRDGAADRLPRVGDAVRLGDDVHQSCELEDPSKKASWARGVAGRIKTAGGGLTSHLAPPGPFSSVFMETKTRTTTGRLSVRPASGKVL